VSTPIDALVTQARTAEAGRAPGASPSAADRQRLELLASEFESMLMGQVLRDMRRSGRWDDDEKGSDDSQGAQSLFEMIDAELVAQMSKAQGLGLTKQLLAAFDALSGGTGPEALAASLDVPAGLAAGSDGTPPLKAADITSAFGWRKDPLTGETRFHQGIDVRAAYGEDVTAPAGGRVVFSGPQGSYGTTVLLEHPNGTQTRVAHLSVALVAAGDTVAPGQLIGRAGASGRATGPHIHLERLDRYGNAMDPLSPRARVAD
jgi:murein DD-endopeptidase MepM/ murein hydrolase activator NlpD